MEMDLTTRHLIRLHQKRNTAPPHPIQSTYNLLKVNQSVCIVSTSTGPNFMRLVQSLYKLSTNF